jgi:hypothetical protein
MGILLCAMLGSVGCSTPIEQNFQAPRVEDYWPDTNGIAWLYEPANTLSYFFRLEVVANANLGGEPRTAFDWYQGSRSEVWGSDGKDRPIVPPFQRWYFGWETDGTLLYYGRDDQGSGAAWPGALTWADTPIVFAGNEILENRPETSQAAGSEWTTVYDRFETTDTFFVAGLQTTVMVLTESTETAAERGTYWLATRRGIVAMEIAGIIDGNEEIVRFELSGMLE